MQSGWDDTVTNRFPHSLMGEQRDAEKQLADRPGFVTLDALDPRDGGTWNLLLSRVKMDEVTKDGMGAIHEMAHTVRFALESPFAVFQGVRAMPGDGRGEAEGLDLDVNDWICYVAMPNERYDLRTGNIRSTSLDRRRPRTFAVYVTSRRVVYWWNWLKAKAVDCPLPDDYVTRFQHIVYCAEGIDK